MREGRKTKQGPKASIKELPTAQLIADLEINWDVSGTLGQESGREAFLAAVELGRRRANEAVPALITAALNDHRTIWVGSSMRFVAVAAAEALGNIGTEPRFAPLRADPRYAADVTTCATCARRAAALRWL